MKYIGEFADVNNKIYKIEITSQKGTGTKNLKLSGTPFTTSMDSDGKTIYTPIKSSGATITILTKEILVDLYSGSALGTKVDVTSDNKTVWTGYLTPCAYSQGFDEDLEELELECVDGLSVLKELPYRSDDKEIKSFLSIIFNCLKRAGCYKYLYVNDNVQLEKNSADSVMEKIRVSESNFFEQKDYELQPDDEVAMSCYDVLYEVMQFIGYTIIADGDEVYILDYDAIRSGRTKYFKYDLSGSLLSIVNLNQSYHITGDSYSENGSKIDLTETFNKLTVVDDFYKIESIVEGLNDSKNWINITSPTDPRLMSWIDLDKYRESMVFTRKNKRGEDESFFIVLAKNWKGRLYFVLGKFFKNPMITTYHYADNNNSKMDETYFNSDMMYSKLWDGKGAVCVGLFTKDIDSDTYDSWHRTFYNNNRPPQYIWHTLSEDRKLEEFGKLVGLSNIENKKLVNYILCTNYDNSHIEHDEVTNYPYFTLKKDIPSVFGGEDGYIIIQGNLIRHDEPSTPFPMQHKDEVSRKNTSIYLGESYFWARLKWGNKYWQELSHFDTLGGEWVDTPTDFKIPYGNNDKEQKANDFFDQDLPFVNTASKIWGLNDENGYYVPAPTDQNLQGTIELTVYANKDTKGKKDVNNGRDKKNSYDTYKPKVVFFKGLDIKLCFADEALNEDAAKEDTYYTNEVDSYQNIKEADEIKCKICTFDDKTPSFSTVDYLDSNGKSQYVDQLYNQATDISLRAEEHIILKNVSQYQEPRISYQANLKNDLNLKPYCLLTDKTLTNRSFIIDVINRDYRYNSTQITMVEKTNNYS